MKVTAVETLPVLVPLASPIQVLGALANAIYLEYMPWFSKLYREELVFKDGNAIVPECPGWGFNFNYDYVRHLNQ